MIATSGTSRPSLDVSELRAAVIRPGGLWQTVTVTERTGSTHDDLLAAVKDGRAGLAEGSVLVAEAQTAGRGRLGRSWVSPARAALTFSVLLCPAGVPVARRGWVPLLTGTAIAEALRAETGVDARLKWPNDVLAGGAKLAGVLAEQAGEQIVVGAGINVTTSRDELPPAPAAGPTVTGLRATSLLLEGAAVTDRGRLLTAILARLEQHYRAWVAAGGDADAAGLHEAYQRLCATLGRDVRVSLPGGAVVTGVAARVDDTGRLIVRTSGGHVAVSAGDVVHVR